MAQKKFTTTFRNVCKLFKIIQISKDHFLGPSREILRFLSVMLYMTRNFHSNISVWKTFPRVQSTKNKNSIFLLPDGNAYWWILIIVVHLWRNFPLSPVLLLTCVLCFFFCLFYYMIIILSCSFFCLLLFRSSFSLPDLFSFPLWRILFVLQNEKEI